MVEEWRPIIGHEKYDVSNMGQIRTYRDCAGHWTGQPRLMSLLRNGDGFFIRLGRRNIYYVHRLVLITFVGPCPDGMECRHLDGNPSNNRVDNLRWGTKIENSNDRWYHDTMPRVLTDEMVHIIRSSSLPSKQLAKELNAPYPAVQSARVKRTYRHL